MAVYRRPFKSNCIQCKEYGIVDRNTFCCSACMRAAEEKKKLNYIKELLADIDTTDVEAVVYTLAEKIYEIENRINALSSRRDSFTTYG